MDKPSGMQGANVVVLVPDDLPSKPRLKPISYSTLFRFSSAAELFFIYVGLFLAVVSGALLPCASLVFGALQTTGITVITADELVARVTTTALVFVWLGIGTFVASYTYMATAVYTSLSASHRIRQEYLKACLRQDIGYFDHVGAGEVASRITSDTLLIQDAMGEKLPLAISSIATFGAAIVIALSKSWRLTLVLLTVVPVMAGTGALMSFVGARFQARIQEHLGTSGTIAEESISAARTVTAFGAQERVASRYNFALSLARSEGMRKNLIIGMGLGIFSFFMYCAYSLCFWYGSILLAEGSMSSGVVINVFFAVLVGTFALSAIAPGLQSFSIGIGAGTKIFETIDRVPVIDPYNRDGVALSKDTLRGDLELKEVDFTYPSRPDVPVLHKISIIIKAGSTVALVGESGSVKSTIIHLLERFYDPVDGSITVDSVPLHEYNLLSLRRHIGYVSQKPVLFEGTVAQNVAYGLTGTEHEDKSWDDKLALVRDACVQANAHGFISKLPEGYETQVGELGMMLCGVQKQRVAIARAIIKDPTILLLDEAISALDSTSERVVQAALDNISKSRTTISVAHRLSTIKNADQIIVMARGKIVARGNHESLVREGELYARLVAAQDIAQKEEDAIARSDEKVEPDVVGLTSTKRKKALGVRTSAADNNVGRLSGRQVLLGIVKLSALELKYLLPGMLGATVSGLIYPFFAIAFGSILQVFSEAGPQLKADSEYWSVIFLILAAISFVSAYLQNTFFALASELLTERLRSLTFRAILRQDISFFDDEQHSTGGMASNLSSDAQAVQGLAGLTLGTLLNIIINLAGNVIVSLIFGWKLALVSLVALPVLIFSGLMRVRILTYFSDLHRAVYERSTQVACESIAAIQTVQSLTREESVYESFAATLAKPLADSFKSAVMNSALFALSESAIFFVNALVFWYGGILIAYEGYKVQSLFTIFMAVVFGSQSAGQIFAYAHDMAKAGTAARGIIKLLQSQPRIDSASTEGEEIKDTEGDIRFEEVFFNYPSRPGVTVLQGLNLHVKAGQFAAMVGASGSGKSTTIALLQRFYDVPHGGRVTIDGRDIATLNVAQYRRQIGLVSQEPDLFDLTIAENIDFGCLEPPSRDELDMAAKGRTTIASVQQADVIFVLKDGVVAEKGTADKLFKLRGLYYELAVQLQLSS